MLQRIQSVWLFFATASLFSMFIFPYVQFSDASGLGKVIKVTGVYEGVNGQIVQTEPFTLLMIATVVLAFIPFLIIFYYKNRKFQMTLCYLTIVLIIGHSFWLAQNTRKILGTIQLDISNYSIGAILPSLGIIFVLMAIRGIRKDDKLIKSTDRLR